MLKSILNDAQLSSKAAFSIVLLPPITESLLFSSSSSSSAQTTAFLQSHVFYIPWGSSLFESTNARLKMQKKKNVTLQDEDAQLLISMNDTVYETHGGHIFCHHSQRRAKITHAELLYTLPGNPTCTHLVLSIDQHVIDLPAATINDDGDKQMQQQYQQQQHERRLDHLG